MDLEARPHEMKDGRNPQSPTAAVDEREALSRSRRAISFIKRHGLEFFLGTTSVGLGVAYCLSERSRGELLLANASMAIKINELEGLCAQKDRCFAELMSDALRHGSSLAGLFMYERKEYLGK